MSKISLVSEKLGENQIKQCNGNSKSLEKQFHNFNLLARNMFVSLMLFLLGALLSYFNMAFLYWITLRKLFRKQNKHLNRKYSLPKQKKCKYTLFLIIPKWDKMYFLGLCFSFKREKKKNHKNLFSTFLLPRKLTII